MGEERATKLVAQLVTSFVVAPLATDTQRVAQVGGNYGAQLVAQRETQLVAKLVVASWQRMPKLVAQLGPSSWPSDGVGVGEGGASDQLCRRFLATNAQLLAQLGLS